MRYEYSYYADGMLKEKTASGRTLLAYEYDLDGNLISQRDITGKVTRYEYDSLNRLTSAVYPEYAEQFTYDKAGNRLSHRVVNKTSPQGNGTLNKNIQYTCDNCNRLLTKTDMLAKDNISDSVQYTYDICGNLISDGAGTYSYDDFNRLSKLEKANGEAFGYRYDSEGLRAEVEENGKLVQYIFNKGKEVIAEESEEKGNCKYYVTDEHGSVSHILNENAEIENEYTYDAFENIISSSEKVHNIFAYCGEQL